MNTKFNSILILVLIFLFSYSSVIAQNTDSEQNPFLLPNQEKFEEVDALASPWRVGRCPDAFYTAIKCHEVNGADYSNTSHTSLYNEDGSLWYKYGNQHIDPDFYRKNKTIDFLPFASYGDFGNNAILRMVGESKNWYKVEVNENTRAVKFVSKSDPHWEKTNWEFWLAKIEVFDVNKVDETKIYDKPDGNIIGVTSNSNLKYLRYINKREGDWVYIQAAKGGFCYPVEVKTKQCYPGWIRWRENRKILIIPYEKIFTITEINSDLEN